MLAKVFILAMGCFSIPFAALFISTMQYASTFDAAIGIVALAFYPLMLTFCWKNSDRIFYEDVEEAEGDEEA